MATGAMVGFDERWSSPEDYILGITEHIWEARGVQDLEHLYSPDIPVRFPSGHSLGSRAVIDGTWATLQEFPDRCLLGEDVIWSDDADGGFLSSHRIVSTATHLADGAFGPASGHKLVFRTIADCAVRDHVVYDEWLVRDVGAMVRQLGHTPESFAARQIEAEGGAARAVRPLTPQTAAPAIYTGSGNDHEAGRRYAEMLAAVAHGDFDGIETGWDRAVQLDMPGHRSEHGWHGVRDFWARHVECLPDATLHIDHVIGRQDPGLGERAALRWWLSGTHDGPGIFGEPTGARLHIMGASHAEFGPRGLRREWIVYDEVAVWKQVLLARAGETGAGGTPG